MKKISALAASCLLVAGMAACSNGGQDGKSGESASDKLAPVSIKADLSGVTQDEAVSALVPDAVKKDGKLTLVTEASYAPAEYFGDDGKTFQGYEIDVAQALATTMGLKLDMNNAAFDSIFPAVGTNYEASIAAITINEERAKQYNLIQYFQDGNTWTVAAGNPSAFNPINPCGATVGVQTGTAQDEYLQELNKTQCADKPVSIQKYDSQAQVSTVLAGKQLTAMLTDTSVATAAVEQHQGKLETIGEEFDPSGRGVLVAEKDADLAKAVQAGVQKLIDSGDLAKIYKAWGITKGVPEKAEIL
ncbi:MAG: transporter substrate-binding domain-containing protein [Actinomycetaceae bacterium]|nr:transporter substrate-binding domain-containing protein [Actinomycetaceae bacterium]MDY5854973.1 transporter substrate-binding domain-containing protein [Arcanobacterium sp.]